MKFAIWIYLLAVTVAAAFVGVTGALYDGILREVLHGKPLPGITRLVTQHSPWAFAIPCLFALSTIWLNRPGVLTVNRTLGFAALATLAIVLLFAFTALALSLPFVPFIVGMSR